MTKNDYPTVFLFVKEEAGGILRQLRFDGRDFSAETLRVFLRQNTGHRLPVKGCMEKFDRLADRMLGTRDAQERVAAIREAEQEAKAETRKRRRTAADFYVKVMKKIAAEGEEFTRKEAERTTKLLEEERTMSEPKKDELRDKLNVLWSLTWQEYRKDAV